MRRNTSTASEPRTNVNALVLIGSIRWAKPFERAGDFRTEWLAASADSELGFGQPLPMSLNVRFLAVRRPFQRPDSVSDRLGDGV